MPRTIQLSVSTELTTSLVQELKSHAGLLSLRMQEGGSLQPPGDVLSFEVSNGSYGGLMRRFDELGLLSSDQVSISTSRPMSLVSRKFGDEIRRDNSEASWEEAAQTMAHESGMTINTFLLMFLAGVLGTIGIATNAIHVVVGAMIIAPGFAPIARITMGLVADHRDWKLGVRDLFAAYGAIIAGAIITDLVLMNIGEHPQGGSSSYLPPDVLIPYWLNVKGSTILISMAGAIAGGVVIITNRSVLTNGVMIALALVPAACMMGMGIASLDASLFIDALIRFALEVGMVALFTALVFLWKKATVQRRVMQG